jgi:hypothetical protein
MLFMGIYFAGTIFGIQIYNFNHNEFSNILFEKKCDEIMSDEQKKEAYLFYQELNNKNEICFKIYTECCSTQDIHNLPFMTWHTISSNIFLEKFNI